MNHSVSVDDQANTTTCKCGLTMNARPGANPATIAFVAAHRVILANEAAAVAA